MVLGSSPPGPFNRAAALNRAAEGSWDVAVVADADVVAEASQVEAAIARALETGRICFAFDVYQGLTAETTRRILSGRRARWSVGIRYRSKVHESSLVAVPREAWDRIGGFDPGFEGWGQEDVAFAQAARILVGPPERVPGIVWHLWHPRAPERRPELPGFRANQERGARYREARTPEEIRAIRRGTAA